MNFISFVILGVIPRFAAPVESMLRRSIVKTFPPNRIVVKIVANVCKDSILHAGVKSIRIGVLVCTGSNAEESVFGVYSPKTSV